MFESKIEFILIKVAYNYNGINTYSLDDNNGLTCGITGHLVVIAAVQFTLMRLQELDGSTLWSFTVVL